MRKFALLLILLLIAGLATAAELGTKKALNLEVAKEVAAAAESYAQQQGWNVVIAILDDGGHLIYLQRQDNVQIGSIEIALRKAQTSVNFRAPSKRFADRLADGATGLVGLPGALPFDGGLPIVVDGQTIGAIGVSGATATQDGQIAKAGIDALPRILGE